MDVKQEKEVLPNNEGDFTFEEWVKFLNKAGEGSKREYGHHQKMLVKRLNRYRKELNNLKDIIRNILKNEIA